MTQLLINCPSQVLNIFHIYLYTYRYIYVYIDIVDHHIVFNVHMYAYICDFFIGSPDSSLRMPSVILFLVYLFAKAY